MTLPMKMTRRKLVWLLAVALVFIPVLVAAARHIQSELFKYEVRKMSEKIHTLPMKTLCVGRFLVDVPADATVSFHRAFLSGWTINSDSEESDNAFVARIAAKESELAAQKNEKGWKSLESVTDVSNEEVRGKVFVFDRHWLDWTEDKKRVDVEAVAVHGHARSHGTSYEFTAQLIDSSDAIELKQLLSQLRTRTTEDIPTQPGFCFDHAIMLDPLTAAQHEGVTVFIGLKDHPDVSIALDSSAGLKTQLTFFARMKENSVRRDFASHFHTLRHGERSLAGVPGEENLEFVSENNGTMGHNFMWEAIDTPDDLLRPQMTLELQTGTGAGGKPVESSMSSAAALALWDKMSSSLRVRPTRATPPPSALVEPPVPLGTRAGARQACPASGWWRCTEDDAKMRVAGGNYRYFGAGDEMPQAQLLMRPTLWQRVKGEQPRFTPSWPTQWVLADYDRHPQAGTAAPAPQPTPAPKSQPQSQPNSHPHLHPNPHPHLSPSPSPSNNDTAPEA